MLPGLGPMSIIAIMIPIAIQIGDPASILLSGVYYGAIFGGSTSSILINAPRWDGRIVIRRLPDGAGRAGLLCSFAGGPLVQSSS